MQYMINNRVFADGVPFTKQDITYAKAIMNQGPYIYCALARAISAAIASTESCH